jgi:hypothetical protein
MRAFGWEDDLAMITVRERYNLALIIINSGLVQVRPAVKKMIYRRKIRRQIEAPACGSSLSLLRPPGRSGEYEAAYMGGAALVE